MIDLSLFRWNSSFVKIFPMIQRIQSIFLLLVAVSMILLLFYPVWQKVSIETGEMVTLTAFDLRFEEFDSGSGERTQVWKKDNIYVSILAVLASAVAFFSISRYKNRLRQIQLGALNSLFIGGNLVIILFITQKAEPLLNEQSTGDLLFGFYLPVVALLFNFMANRFIRKDEKLVRSADRIR